MKVHSKDRIPFVAEEIVMKPVRGMETIEIMNRKSKGDQKGVVYSACTAPAAEKVCLRREKESTACSCNTNEKQDVPACKIPTESRKEKETDFPLKKSLSNEGVCVKKGGKRKLRID